MSNRVIKFRAWDIKEKIMRHILIDVHWLISGEPIGCQWVTSEIDDGWLRNQSGTAGGVDEFILEQFTGLHDKNGEESYHNDICKYLDLAGNPQTGEIVWRGSGWWLEAIGGDDEGNQDVSLGDIENFNSTNEFEVIGNIHENAELLEER